MNTEKKILLTGAAGFIGSYILGCLNRSGYEQVIIVDDFTDEEKWWNLDEKKYLKKIVRSQLFDWLQDSQPTIDLVLHLGARTDTTEFDYAVHEKWNVSYSKEIWNFCYQKNIPLIYASSAATYGAGEFGYIDSHEIIHQLQPLNPYGVSKNEFDKWALQQKQQPPFWTGLKFFNVYGPNEYHKGRMASMVFHGYHQIKKTGSVKLFKSHRPDFENGGQLRDFIYVADIAKVCLWMIAEMLNAKWEANKNGLYNLGTGKARSFNELLSAVFNSMQLPVHIEYIDTPADIRDKYQYFTEANMHKLQIAGYTDPFYSVEAGVHDYVSNYLSTKKYF